MPYQNSVGTSSTKKYQTKSTVNGFSAHGHGGQLVEVWCSGASTCWTVPVSDSTRHRIAQQRRSQIARSREQSWWRTLHSHVLQARNIGKQSSTLVDKVLGSRTTSQADQSTLAKCARDKALNGKPSSVRSVVTSQSCSRQSGRSG